MYRSDPHAWNPYLAGALSGLLLVISVVVSMHLFGSPKYFGTSTTFVRAAGLLERSVDPQVETHNAYYAKTKLNIDFQFLFVVGITLGALGSALADKSFKIEDVPPIWSERFGPKAGTRALAAFLGGIAAIIGVRMAGGCPSGHGLSGLSQLSASAFVALPVFFGTGVLVANRLYRKGGRS